MQDSKNEKILVIESDRLMGERIEKLLIRSGYEVRWVNSSYAAIAALESSVDLPFALVISAYRIPRMNGDDLLEHARFIAPDTQRMLFADSSEMDALINAVNRAAIHSCIAIPFEDEQLMTQVSRRCEQFRQIQKRESLKKVTEHQNRQMYEIIINLKKKKKLFEQKIREKQKTIKMLTSGHPYHLEPDKEGVFDSGSVFKEFKRVAGNLKLFIEDLAFDGNVKLDEMYDTGDGGFKLKAIYDTSDAVLKLKGVDNDLKLKRVDSDGDSTFKHKKNELAESDRRLLHDTLNLFFRYELSKLIQKEFPEASLNRLSSSLPNEGLQFNYHVKYYFDNNHTPLKVKLDGKSDHLKRGNKPFVLKDALLAEKIPFKNRILGADVSDNPISSIMSNTIVEAELSLLSKLEEPVSDSAIAMVGCPGKEGHLLALEEPLFSTGTNTRFSEDKLKIFATADGQPHLDIMGTVSVFPEMHIQGDVDFNTGNLNFSGNIVINGAVKAGLKIKCANLTVQAIDGAQINLTGDLDVGAGIINAQIINVQGKIRAQYINNSRIKALGDIIVQKEIIDSELFSGGQCINANGLISSSFINARRGVQAGRIGTEKSAPSKLEVGTEGIIEMMIADLDERVQKHTNSIKELQEELLSFESEEKILRGRIAGAAYIQDRSQIELRSIEKQLPQIEACEDIQEVKRLFKAVKNFKSKMSASEKIILEAFEQQDVIVEKTLLKQRQIDSLDSQIRDIRLQQKAVKAFGGRTKPKTEVTVKHQLMSGTTITGPRSRLILQDDVSGGTIQEVLKRDDNGMLQAHKGVQTIYEMVLTPF
ncbi:MAG: DUF342 domain-containing protein [Desulfamplus sp.]|nr:DUF342 domain-containing protein [Desulfamplus sp.]